MFSRHITYFEALVTLSEAQTIFYLHMDLLYTFHVSDAKIPPSLALFKAFCPLKEGRPHLGHFMIVVGFILSHLDDVEVT
jgi:hypothetical protein